MTWVNVCPNENDFVTGGAVRVDNPVSRTEARCLDKVGNTVF